MPATRWIGLAIVLGALGCRARPSAEPHSAGSGPAEPQVTDEVASTPIFAVRQIPPPLDVYEWSFDPSGERIAATFEDPDTGAVACGVWAIESGVFVRGFAGDDPSSPCEAWSVAATPERSADGALVADVSGSELVIRTSTDEWTLPDCQSCGGLVAWAPAGHQLATTDGTALELWDADTGEQLRSEYSLDQDHELLDLRLGWNEEGPVLTFVHEVRRPCRTEDIAPDCEWDDPESPPMVVGQGLSTARIETEGAALSRSSFALSTLDPLELYSDRGLRWLAFNERIDGEITSVRVLGTGSRTSALTGPASPPSAAVRESLSGLWRADASTQWIEGYARETFLTEIEIGWLAVVTEPSPTVLSGRLFAAAGDNTSGEIEVFAAASGAIAAEWRGCAQEHDDATCESGEIAVPDGCTLLDVSPTLALALVECETVQLVDAGGHAGLFAQLDHAGDIDWAWGRGNWLAIHSNGRLELVDLGTGEVTQRREGVISLIHAPLAAAHELVVVQLEDQLELVHGGTGGVVLGVAGEYVSAAISPDGSRLAAFTGGEVRIVDLATGEQLRALAIADAFELAWRQDGKLFYGYGGVPTHLVDPVTGAIEPLDHPVLGELSPDEIDPSWRWIHRPDGSVVRTLDFTSLHIRPDGVYMDTGVYEGSPTAVDEAFRFRTSADPNVAPLLTVAQLELWLHRPGLLAAFFAGEPIAAPRQLDARR